MAQSRARASPATCKRRRSNKRSSKRSYKTLLLFITLCAKHDESKFRVTGQNGLLVYRLHSHLHLHGRWGSVLHVQS